MNPKFFIAILKAIMVGDVINALGYRIRPYEVVPGATDRGARSVARQLIHDAFAEPKEKSLLWALHPDAPRI